MTQPRHHHSSETLLATATQWQRPVDDTGRITLLPGDWQVHMVIRAPIAADGDPNALRRLLEYALATLDHADRGPDAHLDDPEA